MARSARTQPIIAAPMPLMMCFWLRLRKLRRTTLELLGHVFLGQGRNWRQRGSTWAKLFKFNAR